MNWDEFLKYDDEEFLENAYKIILNRPIDEEGRKYYLNFLRNGERTKKQIIINIMASPEARNKKKIKNFIFYKFWYFLYKIPVVSTLVKTCSFLLNINNFVKRIRMLENKLYRINKELKSKIDKIDTNINFQSKLYKNELIKLNEKIESYTAYINNLKNRQLKSLNLSFENLKDKEFEHFYLELENNFRGSKEEIKTRLKRYLPYIKALKIKNKKILDCGCGRGEWLELMSEEGENVIGVDTNEIMTNELKKIYNIVNDNILNYLKDKSEEFSVITAFHLIEHLSFEQLIIFLRYAYEALQKGGFILLETPNPKNITVGACNFYMDPTHKKPIPPQLAKFLLEYIGFKEVEIIPHKKEKGEFIEDWVNQSEDYAVIGYKI